MSEEELEEIGRSCAAKNVRRKGGKLIIDVKRISKCINKNVDEQIKKHMGKIAES